MRKLSHILILILGFPLLCNAQIGARDLAQAQVSATIVIPIAAIEASQLNFGRFFPGEQGGTIMISPEGAVFTSSTVVPDASPKSPGSFFVTGEVDATYSIALPNSPSILTNSDASKTMEVSDWVTLPGNGEAGIKLSGGSQTVLVGATLKVGSPDDNPKGVYTGSYQITFAYN